MSQLRRGAWEELELRNVTDETLMYCSGWTNDWESLILPLHETGWFATSWQVWDAAESAELKWGWVGVDDSGKLVLCSMDGEVSETGEIVGDVEQVTLARIASPA